MYMIKWCLLIALCVFWGHSGVASPRGARRGGERNFGTTPSFADIRYADKRPELTADDPSSDRLLDIYLPKTEKPVAGYPCVMFIHGGGFSSGDKFERGRVNPVCEKLLEHGYAIISINYYLLRKHSASRTKDMAKATRMAVDDAELALKWIAENAQKYDLDLENFALCGGSAGSMTCLELAYVRRPSTPVIRCVIDLWGLMQTPGKIMASAPPMLLLHGDRDRLINISRAYAIKKRLDEVNVKNRLIVMQGKGHAQYREVSENYVGDILAFLRECMDKR